MNCHSAQMLLNPYLDDELSLLRSRRVHRHLQRCDHCAAEAEAIRELQAETTLWMNESPPSQLEERIRQAIAAESTAPLSGATITSPPDESRLRCSRPVRLEETLSMKRWTLSLALIALVGIGGIFGIGLRPRTASGELLRAEAAFRRLESAHFIGRMTDVEGKPSFLEMWYARPNRFWRMREGRLEVSDGSQVGRYRVGSRTASVEPLTASEDAMDWGRFFDLQTYVQEAKTAERHGQAGIVDLGTQAKGGKSVRGLRMSGPRGLNERVTLWVDPKTELMESLVIEKGNGQPLRWKTVFASTRIEYDVTPPTDQFRFTAPYGVKAYALKPGNPGQFANRIVNGPVLATVKDQIHDHWSDPISGNSGEVELLAFTRSDRGNLFATVKGSMSHGSSEDARFELTDSSGGRYAEAGFGVDNESGYTRIFFPLQKSVGTKNLTYTLRVLRTLGDHDNEDAAYRESASFTGLIPSSPPPGLDDLAEDFAHDDMNSSLESIRNSTMGFAFFRSNRFTEANGTPGTKRDNASRRLRGNASKGK